MEPVIREMPEIVLAGFSFFGNPFHFSGGWTEENEIGRLCQRFFQYFTFHPEHFSGLETEKEMLEMHILHEESRRTGEYEVFVGVQLKEPVPLPVTLSLKIVPATLYAVFSLAGETISSDWERLIYTDWMNQSPYESAGDYSIQWYDERFKGLDRLDESVLDVYIPIRLRGKENVAR